MMIIIIFVVLTERNPLVEYEKEMGSPYPSHYVIAPSSGSVLARLSNPVQSRRYFRSTGCKSLLRQSTLVKALFFSPFQTRTSSN